MHSYEAWAGLLKFINDLCLDQVTLNHLIPRGHVEPMLLPTVFLRKRQVHCVSPKFYKLDITLKKQMDNCNIATAISIVCSKPEAALGELSRQPPLQWANCFLVIIPSLPVNVLRTSRALV